MVDAEWLAGFGITRTGGFWRGVGEVLANWCQRTGVRRFLREEDIYTLLWIGNPSGKLFWDTMVLPRRLRREGQSHCASGVGIEAAQMIEFSLSILKI